MLVYFVHPDLGIGGAEMLVVNAAVSLLQQGHDVRIYTAHHDPTRCFSETAKGGVLFDKIRVHGAWIPRTLLGRFHVVCAVVRMIWIAFVISFQAILHRHSPDVFFCDQVSQMIPILRWATRRRVLFYCHFPDKLLCVDRDSWVKRVYRMPVDWLEENTTGAADTVVVNSRFTESIFRQAFQSLKSINLGILYPAIDLAQFDRLLSDEDKLRASEALPQGVIRHIQRVGDGEAVILLSINRFERKKNLSLAIEMLDQLSKDEELRESQMFEKIHLVMAGGYDSRLAENVEYMQELTELVEKNELQEKVSFLKSFSDDQRLVLMKMARCVVYTPDKEHFGIVPIEAMYTGVPVVAVASGGPLESVLDGKTGFLREQNGAAFAQAVKRLVLDKSLAEEMGRSGKASVRERFSLTAFGAQLEALLKEQLEPLPPFVSWTTWLAVCFVGFVAVFVSSFPSK